MYFYYSLQGLKNTMKSYIMPNVMVFWNQIVLVKKPQSAVGLQTITMPKQLMWWNKTVMMSVLSLWANISMLTG